MKLLEIIGLAQHWLLRRHEAGHKDQMASSARLCLDDARRLWHAGQLNEAKNRALKSLAYSVGICHQDYQAASKA